MCDIPGIPRSGPPVPPWATVLQAVAADAAKAHTTGALPVLGGAFDLPGSTGRGSLVEILADNDTQTSGGWQPFFVVQHQRDLLVRTGSRYARTAAICGYA